MKRAAISRLRTAGRFNRSWSHRARLLALFLAAVACPAQQLRPGVWGGTDLTSFPLPVSGYDVYMLGEMHGFNENVPAFLQYLNQLYEKTGLRDVAVEEKSAYEHDAQAYIEGKSNAVPPPLCLRTDLLNALRRFNQGRNGNELVLIHLVDIDLNPAVMREHLLALKKEIPGSHAVSVPEVPGIKAHGLEAVAALERLTRDAGLLGQLRTVGHSIRAFQQGLEIGNAGFTGSPYLDDREDAIVTNVIDIVQQPRHPALLALYGNDHVSKTPLHNGGPKQDRDFPPAALRLEKAGIKVYSVVSFPLAGRWNWRGLQQDTMWSASDGHLASGEALDRVLASSPASTLLFIDPRRERVALPSQDLTRSGADAFLMFTQGTPAANRCAAR